MKEILLRKSGLYEESSKIIDKYIKKYPEDISVRLDEIRVEFLMRHYGDVINSSLNFLKTFGNLNSKYELISVKYLYGLSLIALKKFSEAIEILESIDFEEAKKLHSQKFILISSIIEDGLTIALESMMNPFLIFPAFAKKKT